ncbi:DUF4956 domain-containing protein [Mangrovibacterium diazotrophicum]|uniref:Uncharacterized protein DUF4956 n=1 Tax=Mangrovibacterium diazotrophicum TaxID=1261403 RepID=A0A419W5N6_9BACT|nr:DUF4956 domain-containing protein [Mangrovibacterium diazotrophicum]RKD90730.1 uncharacterized protein DUF4956 [Mangrovibacterium diazotrophicum]
MINSTQGMPLLSTLFFESSGFFDLLLRYSFNLLVTFVIVRLIYYRKTKRKDYLFTYFLINTMIFLLAYLLSGVELKLGFAFGLFALFGILRYRTNQLQIKEMTYLFIIIGIAVLNSISGEYLPYVDVILANLLVIGLLFVLEYAFRLSHESSKKVLYERIELINENRRDELLEDLRKRTGINIHRVEVSSINFLRDTARVVIYYYEKNRIFNAEESGDEGDDE